MGMLSGYNVPMSIYTQAEFDTLKAAYLKLVAGEKEVQASVSGEFVRFQDSQLSQCKALLDEMAVELGLTPARGYAKQKGRFF
jgi:hypothetical protein